MSGEVTQRFIRAMLPDKVEKRLEHGFGLRLQLLVAEVLQHALEVDLIGELWSREAVFLGTAGALGPRELRRFGRGASTSGQQVLTFRRHRDLQPLMRELLRDIQKPP